MQQDIVFLIKFIYRKETKDMKVNVIGETLTENEINAYKERALEKYPDREVESIDLKVDGDYVDISYHFVPQPGFQRIRRITGYLVGTLDRFNNAKRAEVDDRVKHSLEQ